MADPVRASFEICLTSRQTSPRQQRENKMHFLYTAPRYHTNQHFAVKALIEAGHQVSFLALTRGQSEDYTALTPTVLGSSPTQETFLKWLQKCGHFIGIPTNMGSPTKNVPPLRPFWTEMRHRQPCVVIVRDPLTTYGQLAVFAAKALGARVILYTQLPKHQPLRRKLKRWAKFGRSTILWGTGAHWITPVLGKPLRDHAPRNWHYLPFVIEPQTTPQQKTWFVGDVLRILAVGKYEPRKNHHLFLQVIARLSTRHRIRSTVVGQCTTPQHHAELKHLVQERSNLGLNNIVDFKTNLAFPQVQEEYRQHDLFVLASRKEPAAISPLEAMAHSLPVVCSDSNGTQCYIRPGHNGYVFGTDDAAHLETTLDTMCRNRNELIEMGHRSYRLVVAEHTPARYVDTVVSIAKSGSSH